MKSANFISKLLFSRFYFLSVTLKRNNKTKIGYQHIISTCNNYCNAILNFIDHINVY